jgi:hypothetical protein
MRRTGMPIPASEIRNKRNDGYIAIEKTKSNK